MIPRIVGHGYIPCPLRRNHSGKSPLRPRSVWQGRYAEAEPLFTRSLAIFEKALGLEHPNVATGLENYAAQLRATGRTCEAERMEARAKAIRARHAKENK